MQREALGFASLTTSIQRPGSPPRRASAGMTKAPRKIPQMLLAKQELLAALAAGLEQLSPGAGEKAVFELPKAAAHGDLASTAAMQLAKPLKRNPRQVAEALRESLLASPAF